MTKKARLGFRDMDRRKVLTDRLDRELARIHAEVEADPSAPMAYRLPRPEGDSNSPFEAEGPHERTPEVWRRFLMYSSGGLGPGHDTRAGALAMAEPARAEIVDEMMDEIERCARDLVEPRLVEAALERSDVVNRWPWPEWVAVLDQMTLGYWPGEAAPLDVAKWAEAKLNGVAKRLGSADRPGSRLVQDAERGRGLRTWIAGLDLPVPEYRFLTASDGLKYNSSGWVTPAWTPPDAPLLRYPAAGLALLYLAVRETEQGLKTPFIAVDAGKAHHALISGLRDAPQDGMRHKAAASQYKARDGHVELFAEGHSVQLVLPLEGAGLSDKVITLLRKIRGPEGLRNWVALQTLLSTEGGRQGWVRWTLNDHAKVLGYDSVTSLDPTKRAAIAAQMEAFTKIEIVIYDAMSSPTARHRAPLIQVGSRFEKLSSSLWALDGMELQINPLLYSGVRNHKTKKLGSNWMPAPVGLAAIDHIRFPYIHGFSQIISIRMRWDAPHGRPLRHSGSSLLQAAGIVYESRRATRAWKALEGTMVKLVEIEQLTYQWDGEPWALDSICEMHPAQWIRDRVTHGLTPYEPPPVHLPRTGEDLKQWRDVKGWSQSQAAKTLGLSQQALSKAEKAGQEQLGERLTGALKRLLTA